MGNAANHSALPALRSSSRRTAFTLIEISLAIGIFAFAIVAIFSLFPVGLRSANESRVQSIVTQIARTIISDLRTGAFNEARIFTAPLPTATASAPAPQDVRLFDLSQDPPNPEYLLFATEFNGTSGTRVKKKIAAATFNSSNPDGDFVVKVESKLVGKTPPVLAQVTVTVEAPASAPAANRAKYSVITLMGDTR